MANTKVSGQHDVHYRDLRPSDRETLEHIHKKIFPVCHDPDFYQEVLSGRGYRSWGAVDRSRPDGRSDEVVGFVITRIDRANQSEIRNRLGHNSAKPDKTVVYVLMLGVLEAYRNLGIASNLIRKVIDYASGDSSCQAVYLHAKSDNKPAIHFYKKMSFKRVKRLRGYYEINGDRYDGCLFVHDVNGGRSHRAPSEYVISTLSSMKSGLKSVAVRLWNNEDRKISGLANFKESHSAERNLAVEYNGRKRV